MSLHVGSLDIDLHIPVSRSLKAKRAVVKPLVEALRRRFNVAVGEVEFQDQWQRARLGVAVVASSERHGCEILDEVERFVWANPEVQVLEITRRWLETT